MSEEDVEISDELLAAAAAAETALRLLMDSAVTEVENGAVLPSDAISVRWAGYMTAPQLAEQALNTARSGLACESAIHSGHVFCYHCNSALCEHSKPAAPGEVFSGYTNTGRPQWQEFFNFLLELGDQRIDQLFDDKPPIFARLVGRRRLTNEQFRSFGLGSLTYRIMAQVAAGYIRVGGQRCALTVQVVETRDHMLHVQILTPDEAHEALANASPKSGRAYYRIFDALRGTRRQIEELSGRWQNCADKDERAELRNRMNAVLRHLCTSIEQKGRQDKRRTGHAEQRGREKRPVHKAASDLKNAKDDQFYRDSKTKNVIVLGKSKRAHVFADDGRHVTSLFLEGDMLERRVSRRRYVPLPAEERDALSHAASSGAEPD
jgi:hypothetical protein